MVSIPVHVICCELIAIIDEDRLCRCLVPQLFSTSNKSDLLALLPWLTSICMLALLYMCIILADVMSIPALSSLNDLLTQRSIAMITYIARRFTGTPIEVSPLVISCLRALGANSESLSYVSSHDMNMNICCSTLLRERAAARLVHIIQVFAVYVHYCPRPCCFYLLYVIQQRCSRHRRYTHLDNYPNADRPRPVYLNGFED